MLRSESEMESLGAVIAGGVANWWSTASGDCTRPASIIVFLQGELGAGKTTIARGLLRELGVRGPVKSRRIRFSSRMISNWEWCTTAIVIASEHQENSKMRVSATCCGAVRCGWSNGRIGSVPGFPSRICGSASSRPRTAVGCRSWR